jgi:hypothetical protein
MRAQSQKVIGKNDQKPDRKVRPERETTGRASMLLSELDPHWVVNGVKSDGKIVANGANSIGHVREKCPYCGDVSLQLVLRYRSVIRSHLYCGKCMRCFDALYPDGRSALSPPSLAID